MPKKRHYSYDHDCEVLARHFLEDGTDKAQAEIDLEARDLAQDIQNCVEGFFLVRSKSD